MTFGRSFQGFEDTERQALIVIEELPAFAYSGIDSGFAPSELKAQGIDFENREDVDLSAGPGFIVTARQVQSGQTVRKSALIVRAADITALVIAQVPDAARATYPDAAVRAALLSFTVRSKVPDKEMLAILPYAPGDLAGFRLVRANANGTASMTDGPNDVVPAVVQPLIFIAVRMGERPEKSQTDNFARSILLQLPGLRAIRIVQSEPLRISGQPAYEIISEAVDDRSGADVILAQWLRFQSSVYLQMVGIARKELWDSIYPRMRVVRDGLIWPRSVGPDLGSE